MEVDGYRTPLTHGRIRSVECPYYLMLNFTLAWVVTPHFSTFPLLSAFGSTSTFITRYHSDFWSAMLVNVRMIK